MGNEKLLKWINVLLSQPADSGPQICVAFSALCRHAKQAGDEALILQHKVTKYFSENLSFTVIPVIGCE